MDYARPRWGMAALDKKQVDELIEKYRALAEKEQRRIDELEERNAHLVEAISSSLTVPAAAFGMGYLRGYYGEKATILGISIDAGIGLFLHGLAACFGISLNKGVQTAAKLFHDLANGAFACWAAAMGAELGLKKRMEEPAPLPASQPNTGAEELPKRAPRPMTHEELAAIKAPMALNTEPAMQQPPPVSAPLTAPWPPPITPQQETSPISNNPPMPYQFAQRWQVNPEADMRALLQSVGAPSDPNTVMHLLTHENPGEEFRMILRRARAPAV